ncbi:MAG: diphthine--ammonia ligase [Candidatus Hadarchaeales archaeon]
MKLAALCSGGKDSIFALWLAMKEHEIEKIIFVLPQREDSWMFHHPNVHLYELFSKCIGIPVEGLGFTGGKREEIPFLEKILKKADVEGIVSGVISSKFQKNNLDEVCRKLRKSHIAPLWNREPEEVLREELRSGISFIITGVFAEGLGKEWLGKKVGEDEVRKFLELSKKYGINPCGEGGEYETLVLDAPFFKFRIKIDEAEILWDGLRGVYLVKKAELEEKK